MARRGRTPSNGRTPRGDCASSANKFIPRPPGNKLITPLELLHLLVRTAPRVYPAPNLKDRLQRIKYFLRALAFFPQTRQWFEILQAPELEMLVKIHPRIYSKLQRPYLNKHIGTVAQLKILRQHYRFIVEQFSDAMIQGLCTSEGWLLGQVQLEETGQFSLRLRHGIYEKEGELTITLVSDDEQEAICSITFTVVAWTREQCDALIGGLQGHRVQNDKARIISITRRMHGLRPKALLVFALQQFSSFWDARSLSGVSNATHIYRAIHKRRNVRADYDSFWGESGGQLNSLGIFTLPTVPTWKNISDLPPNKRPVYRRRYEMLTELSDQIHQRLSSSIRTPRLVSSRSKRGQSQTLTQIA